MYEYQDRVRDAYFAYMNSEQFESPAVEENVPTEWSPDDNLVHVTIKHLCRSLYRSLGTRVNDFDSSEQTPAVTTNAIVDETTATDSETR